MLRDQIQKLVHDDLNGELAKAGFERAAMEADGWWWRATTPDGRARLLGFALDEVTPGGRLSVGYALAVEDSPGGLSWASLVVEEVAAGDAVSTVHKFLLEVVLPVADSMLAPDWALTPAQRTAGWIDFRPDR